MTKPSQFYRLNDAARLIGVAPITLKRWLLQHKVEEVRRDRNGWRVFDDADIERIREYATSLRTPDRQ
jgi:DNA-binding transcriptional MerR regulator